MSTAVSGRSAQRSAPALLSGALFGWGLAGAGMPDPYKVLAFLDVTGDWATSLLGVMGAAVVLCFFGFRPDFETPAPAVGYLFCLALAHRYRWPLDQGQRVVWFGLGLGGLLSSSGLGIGGLWQQGGRVVFARDVGGYVRAALFVRGEHGRVI